MIAPIKKISYKTIEILELLPVTIVSILLLAYIAYISIPPTFFFNIKSVYVQPVYVQYSNKDINIQFEKDLFTNLTAEWITEVEVLTHKEYWHDYCRVAGTGVNLYSKGHKTSTMTLDQWTGGACRTVDLVPGTYQVKTSWTFRMPLGYVGTVHNTSSLFNVVESK